MRRSLQTTTSSRFLRFFISSSKISVEDSATGRTGFACHTEGGMCVVHLVWEPLSFGTILALRVNVGSEGALNRSTASTGAFQMCVPSDRTFLRAWEVRMELWILRRGGADGMRVVSATLDRSVLAGPMLTTDNMPLLWPPPVHQHHLLASVFAFPPSRSNSTRHATWLPAL
jgi:hypothetical protein